MKLAFVVDDLSQARNGTTMSAMRYARALREKGHEVRIVAYGATGEGAFPVDRCHYPIVDAFGDAQGFIFGKPSAEVFGCAFNGVDVVHLFLPFKLERAALCFARERGIPVSAAFHLQPENITFNANLSWVPGLADAIYGYFRRGLYDRVGHVHCPSAFMARQLEQHGYLCHAHAISNGVSDTFVPEGPAASFDDGLFHVLTTGRLAREKEQRTLIEAVRLCRHADDIQIHIAGAGPLERMLRRAGADLPHPPRIEFLDQARLVELIRGCDLYVHCSRVDSEAISCIEAFSCGLVPVIADSDLSATGQFVLDERCGFPVGDARALAERIDYLVEHPTERRALSERYVREGERYKISRCVEEFLRMEELAIADDRSGGMAR